MRTCWIFLLLLAASCATAPEAPPPPERDPWLELEVPEVVRSSVPLVEFRGRLAVNELAAADVVLVIDLTNTTLEASGADADRDGIVGTTHPWAEMRSRSDVRFQRSARSWTSDFDDAIVNVQLAAARQLTAALAERNCRVGVVTFTGKPRVPAPLGTPDQALRALEKIRVPVDRSGTQPKLAFLKAERLLDEAAAPRGAARRRVLVFFSDGAETNFRQIEIRRGAERAAARLAARGIRVHALGFGIDEAEDPSIMGRIAAFGRGLYLHIDHPEEVLQLVAPQLEIARIPVANDALPGASARAVRSFADGSFDGFVALSPGENRIEVEVVLGDGRVARKARTVIYEPSAESRPEDAALLEALRDRTAETALAGESQAGESRARSQSLEIRGETGRGENEAP